MVALLSPLRPVWRGGRRGGGGCLENDGGPAKPNEPWCNPRPEGGDSLSADEVLGCGAYAPVLWPILHVHKRLHLGPASYQGPVFSWATRDGSFIRRSLTPGKLRLPSCNLPGVSGHPPLGGPLLLPILYNHEHLNSGSAFYPRSVVNWTACDASLIERSLTPGHFRLTSRNLPGVNGQDAPPPLLPPWGYAAQ